MNETHRTSVVPVKVRAWSPQLRCEALAVVGYRVVCSCGWRSKVYRSIQLARADPPEHDGD